MSEPMPPKGEKQPTVTEIDPEVYKRLCDVVEADTFQSISFYPWHKGCDIYLDATCRWPELEGELESWYYDQIGDFEEHTFALIVPRYDGENLIFGFTGDWNRGNYGESAEGWDGEEFQDLVHNLLPSALKKQASPENLLISLELEYENPLEISIRGFSIFLDEEEMSEFADAITPRNHKVIRDHVIAWCMANHSPDDSFTVSIESNEIMCVVSSCAQQDFLLVPKGTKETDS